METPARPAMFADAVAAVAALAPEVPMDCLRPHVFSAQARQLIAAFPGRVLYAMKANPDPIVLESVWHGGIRDFDIASVGEAAGLARQIPAAAQHFMHPVKSRAAIRTASADFGIRTFVLDHASELEKIRDSTGRMKDLLLFVRVAVPNDRARWRLSNKFGATPGEAVALLKAARGVAGRVGIAFHVGSLCLDPIAFTEALTVSAEIARAAGTRLDVINVGGGFPAAYEGLTVPPLGAFMAAIERGLSDIPLAADGEAWCEAGRALAAPGGSVVVQVIGRHEMRLFINDGIYGSLASPGPPPPDLGLPTRVIAPVARSGQTLPFTLFGPTCDGADRLGGTFLLPCDIADGDYIEIGQHGAYGATLRSDFNGFLPALRVRVADPPLLETPGFRSGPFHTPTP